MTYKLLNRNSLWILTLVVLLAHVGLVSKCLALQESAPAAVANRKALVIGNGNYAHLPGVKSVGLDIKQVGSALKGLGFDVVEVNDAGVSALTSAIKGFTTKVGKGDIVFVYYSGLAVQSNQENYLLPVDFAENENNLFSAAYSVSRIDLELAQRGPAARVLILDASRPIPSLAATYDPGLAVPQLNQPGVLIAFAAQPGRTIVPKEANGPGIFAKEISQLLATPSLSIEDIFNKAQAAVSEATAQEQIPTYYPFRIASLRLKEDRPAGLRASSGPASTETHPSEAPPAFHQPGRYDAVVIGSFTPEKGVKVPPKIMEVLVPALTEKLSSWKLREVITDGKKPTATPALKIEGVINSYTSGSRVARLTVGYGVGVTKTTGHVRLTDATTGKLLFEKDVFGFVGGGLTGGRTEDVMSYFAEAIVKVLAQSGLL